MKISDSIYGEFEIDDVLIEIINTPQVQRLKGIHQAGAAYLVNLGWNVTRYEHSVGTMLLIKMLNGSIEEQIAGLLHDVSHTAFSHVVDYALKCTEENYHEKIYSNLIEESDIPAILSKQGYNYQDILYNEDKWTILERSAPKLCADRIDYTLRDMYHYGYITKDEIEKFLEHLTYFNDEIVINSIESAEWFVETYYKEVIDFFLMPEGIYANARLANALEIALKHRELNLNDLLKEDREVYEILKNSKDKEVVKIIASINSSVKLAKCKANYDIYQKNKLRLIDPSVLIDGVIYSISEKSAKAMQLTELALKKSQEGVYLRIQ